MHSLKVVTYPETVLAQTASLVEAIGKEERELIDLMVEAMYREGGVGIAAPQVGVSKRLFIASPRAKPGEEIIFINPEFVEITGEQNGAEGCLSVPGISVEVRRAKTIKFRALNKKGKMFEGVAKDFFARILQHEMDHLNGKLIIDRVDFDQRQELLSHYQKP